MFLFEFQQELEERERAAHGDRSWTWPNHRLFFRARNGVTLNIARMPSAYAELDLAQSWALLFMLHGWVEQAPQTGFVPTARVQVSWADYSEVVSLGLITVQRLSAPTTIPANILTSRDLPTKDT